MSFVLVVTYLLEGLSDGIIETVGSILGVAEGSREGRALGWSEGVVLGDVEGL